jgi:hypothetical protein
MPTTRYVPIHVNYRDFVLLLITDVKTSGNHNYEHIPFDILKDQTDKGPLWDVTKNFRGFWYTPSSGALALAPGAGIGGALEISEGPGWLNFGGYWGDKKWPVNKFGQFCVGSECHMEDGPLGKHASRIENNYRSPVHFIGPLFKNLGRTAPCQDETKCTVQTKLLISASDG